MAAKKRLKTGGRFPVLTASFKFVFSVAWNFVTPKRATFNPEKVVVKGNLAEDNGHETLNLSIFCVVFDRHFFLRIQLQHINFLISFTLIVKLNWLGICFNSMLCFAE